MDLIKRISRLQCSGPARSPDARPPFVPGMEAAGVADRTSPGTGVDLSVGGDVMAKAPWPTFLSQDVVPVLGRALSGFDR